MTATLEPTVSTIDQCRCDTQSSVVDGDPNSRSAISFAEPVEQARTGFDSQPTDHRSKPISSMSAGPILFDPFLSLAAEVLDDTETVWIANNNRLSVMTRDTTDSDGEERGWGLTEEHPDVAMLASLVSNLELAVKQATKNLEKRMRLHPLGPWVKAQRGLGDKQTARLLASIGDPYWNDLHNRPRTVSELWAYCGFHVLHPGGQVRPETQVALAAGVAPKRQRGQKSNWNEDARKRAWLIAASVIKAGGPYREIYDATKAKYADAVHNAPCVRCGPAGKPAQAGTPLSKGHIDGRGRRAICKAVLKKLWIESKRLHELQAGDQQCGEAQ